MGILMIALFAALLVAVAVFFYWRKGPEVLRVKIGRQNCVFKQGCEIQLWGEQPIMDHVVLVGRKLYRELITAEMVVMSQTTWKTTSHWVYQSISISKVRGVKFDSLNDFTHGGMDWRPDMAARAWFEEGQFSEAGQRMQSCKPHGKLKCPACEDIAATERRAAHAS